MINFYKYEDIIKIENILEAWQEFLCGKRNKPDIQKFSLRLMDNVFDLHYDLVNHTYKHGGYQQFKINDPKPRTIHKAAVRDRLTHHAIYRILYPFFDRVFIADSFSCRLGKGTHKAINRFRYFSYKVGKNNTRQCWVLKGDIKKFFASINHSTLINILEKYVLDKRITWLLKEVISSFNAKPNTGLPLGNLTSQLLANIYMNEFDQFMKHKLKARHYIRYSDDFVILSQNRQWLEGMIRQIQYFLKNKLKLELHPNKISIKTLSSGEDFLGWVNFPDHRILRITTRKRMFKRMRTKLKPEVFNSCLGLLKHGNANKIRKEIFKNILKIEFFSKKG